MGAIDRFYSVSAFVYFSTCSVYDAKLNASMYIRHKSEMEELVTSHPNYLIFRLPQVVGVTQNPYTLVNYLYYKILYGEKFTLMQRAMRNIIDVDDVTAIVKYYIKNSSIRNEIINVANTNFISVKEVVAIFEKLLQKKRV